MERKTEYTLREVAKILKVELDTIRTHVKRNALKTKKVLRQVEFVRYNSVKPQKKSRIVHVVSLSALLKYKKLIKLRKLCK